MTEAISQPHTPSSRKGPERTSRAGSHQGPRPPALRSTRTAPRFTPARTGRQTQGHAGPSPEPPRQGVTGVTRRGGPATPLPRPVTQCRRPRPPPGAEQSAREAVAGLGQGPRQRHVGGGGGDRAGATNKGTRASPGTSPPRPGPAEPGRQGALRGAARGQCARGPRAALTWVRAPRGPPALPSQSCARPHARLTCGPPRLPTGPPWLARAPRRPSPSQTAPPHPRSSPRPPPAPRPPRRTRTAPAELRRPRRPGARRRRRHCAGAGRRRSLAARAGPGAAHLEGGARTRGRQVRAG